MRASNCLVAMMAMLLVAGCSSEESAAPASPAPDEQASAPATQPPSEPAPQVESPGLAVGEQAPAFELPDQHGQPQSLAGILETGSAALVFYRSADW